MKIGVCVKPVIKTDIMPKYSNENKEIIFDGQEFVINPFDEYAIEMSMKIKDELDDIEVISISYTNTEMNDIIREVLAIGIDKGIVVDVKNYKLICDSYNIAENLRRIINKENVDVLIAGKEASDTQNGIVPIIIAKMMSWPVITNAISTKIENNELIIERENEFSNVEVVKCRPPVVLTVTKNKDKPRYPDLFGIMNAKNKEIEVVEMIKGNGYANTIKNIKSVTNEKKCVLISDGDNVEKAEKMKKILIDDLKII